MNRVTFIFAALLTVAFVSQADAQARREQAGPKPEFMRVTGKVSGVARGLIKITAPAGEYVVKPNPQNKDLKVSVTGQADSSFLKTGQPVRFTVTMDKKGNAQSEVTELELFTPHPVTGRFGVAKIGEEEGKYDVAGQLSKLTKKREFSLATGKVTVKGTFAEDAKVDVRLEGPKSLQFVRTGDTITVAGKGFGPVAAAKRPGQLLADEIDIKLEAALGSETKPGDKKGADKPGEKKEEKKPEAKE